jgi:hypothetical protein
MPFREGACLPCNRAGVRICLYKTAFVLLYKLREAGPRSSDQSKDILGLSLRKSPSESWNFSGST